MCCYPMSQLYFEGSGKVRMVALSGPVGGQFLCSKDLDSHFGHREETRYEVFQGHFCCMYAVAVSEHLEVLFSSGLHPFLW